MFSVSDNLLLYNDFSVSYHFTKRMEENKMNYYLGFDAGTQSVKVAVYDEDMNCIVSSSAPTTLTYPDQAG